MYRTQARRDRRQRDRDQRRAAANRRIGHDMAYVYEVARFVGPVLTMAAIAAGVWWVWTHVEHGRIAAWLAAAGALACVGGFGWMLFTGSTRARMMRLAHGRTTATLPAGLTAVAGVLLLIAAVIVWRTR